ncbi:gamma-glutamylcyclotransferase family protein [Pelagibacterium xiamenense]|uniref:gamma-glutamylcyclotransferase family protein n=1 Tax=Pelagibacterium xiamenense TaxID=2901140 RepID=UPI001E420BD1|nr:gamma-glutamylcyclotransferase family protein [Pelagibacterium xiamenense]MCD7061436.1 gamma-glutamylcyclotransferase [Pelagibacterium xiamenense]
MSPEPPALPLFVYGTLRDAHVLAAVIGRHPAPAEISPASAPDFRAVYYPGHTFPAIVLAPGVSAPGLLLYGLTEPETALLDAYEGDDYVRARLTVTAEGGARTAWAYLPTAAIPAGAPGWTLERWNEIHRPRILDKDREEDANV